MDNSYVSVIDGVYRIPGTRVSIDSIVYDYLSGLSPESITDNFDTSLEQVYGAITFYLSHRDEVDKHLMSNRAADLTKREKNLLALHLQGLSNDQIASALSEDVKITRVDMNAVVAKIRYRLQHRDYDQTPSHRHPGESHIDRSLEDSNLVTISASEFEQLSAKTAEILEAAAVAYKRMAIDQEEIEQLKTETRALLAGLRAA